MADAKVAASWRRRAGLAIVGTLIGLIVGELALRGLEGDDYRIRSQTPLGSASERLAQRAGRTRAYQNGAHASFDADGFRVEHVDGSGPTILFVGDSFAEGFGVDDGESFAAATCTRLHARCLNAGIEGVGTTHELRLLREMLDARPLDAVVFQIFTANDLVNDWEEGGFRAEEGALVELVPPEPPLRIRWRTAMEASPWVMRSYVARAVMNGALQPFGPPEVGDADFELERLLLGATSQAAHEHGVPIVYVVVGSPERCTRPDGAARWIENAVLGPPVVRFGAILDALGDPWIDLCALATDRDDYSAARHFSVDANDRIGAVIAERLRPVL